MLINRIGDVLSLSVDIYMSIYGKNGVHVDPLYKSNPWIQVQYFVFLAIIAA